MPSYIRISDRGFKSSDVWVWEETEVESEEILKVEVEDSIHYSDDVPLAARTR